MSQPPLTYQLKLLEKDLGVMLFNRTTRSLEITDAGKQLLVRARQILDLWEMTQKEVVAIGHQEMNLIRVGFVASSSALLSPKHLSDFHDGHEEIKFEMREGSSHKILELLNMEMIDVGLVRTPFNAEPYAVDYLQAEPMIAVYNNQRYAFEHTIGVKALKGAPLVLDKRFSDLIESTCHQQGVVPNIICLGEDSRSILSWTVAGMGVAILPYSGKEFMHSGDLSFSTIDSKALETHNAIVTLKNKEEKPLIKDFINSIKTR
jgi:DNA-binding transcriptional LysR family regulator